MEKRNKFILGATGVLLVALLAGCTPSQTVPDETSNPGSFDPNVSEDDSKALVKDEFDSDGKLLISFFGIDLDSLQAPTADTTKIINYIQDKFQVKFTYQTATVSSWKTILNQDIGGGDVPDIFFHTRDEPSYSSWLDDEYLFNYSKYLANYPNLKAAFDRYNAKEMKTYLGGDFYGYPIVMNQNTDKNIINEHCLYYRRDWYDALKAKNFQPSSGRALVDPEDASFNYLNFYDLCEGFTKGDPDGNGQNDTYAYALTKDGGVYWWYPLVSMFNVIQTTNTGWSKNESTGRWEPDCISDKMKEAVMWIADLYDHGYINSNYATTATQTVMKNDFVNGVAGMMTYNATYPAGKGILDLMASFTSDSKPLSEVCRAMPVVTGKDGTKQVYGYGNYYGFNSIDNDVTSNKKRKIMSIMDWMLSDEGQTLLNYGIEGVHYKLENGKIVSLLGNDTRGYPKTLYNDDVAPGIYRIKGLVSWSTMVPDTIEHYSEQMQLLNAWNNSGYLKNDPLFYCSVDPSYSLTISSLNDATEIAFKKIVSKNPGDRDSVWSSYAHKWAVTGSSYINAMNDAAQLLEAA